MNIKEFISKRLFQTVEQIREKSKNLEFILFFEIGAVKKSQSTKEDMANWWSLPYSVNRRLSFNELIDRMHYFDSIAPLWIKTSKINDGLIGLELSQKLRNRKEILNHHKNSDLAPFIIKPPYLEFGDNEERQGMLDFLTLTLKSDKKIGEYFNSKSPKFDEIVCCIKKNFDNNYLFFPNNYNHRSKDEPGYSELIIQKNFKDDSYQLTNHDDKIFKKSSDLNELIGDYIKQELKYRIGQIEIEK